MVNNRIELAQKIANNILLPLNIPYVVGGSVASTLRGKNKYTGNLDLVIDMEGQTAQRLIDAISIDAMSSQIFISEWAVNKAIAKSKTASGLSFFTLIYWPPKSMGRDIMVTFFVMSSQDTFLVSVMSRRQLFPFNDSTEKGIYIYSTEDIILQKLNWYKLWDSSQKHWSHVLEVLEVQKDKLDLAYLYRWAIKLEVADLLIKAMSQSGY